MNTELMNFRIPTILKNRFRRVCRSRNVQMTSVMNQMIANYVKQNDAIELSDADYPVGFFIND